MDVYDADLNLIEWAQTPLLDYAEFAQISINRDAFDISFVVISGTNGGVYIDNLRANVIPEPATLLLFGLGGIFISVKRRAQARISYHDFLDNQIRLGIVCFRPSRNSRKD